jgi:hypothetical protein
MGIVGGDVTFYLGDLLSVRTTCFNDPPAPLGFAVLVVLLGLPKGLLGFPYGNFVSLLAAEHPAEPSFGLRFEVRPLERRDGDRILTKIKVRHSDAAPKRGEADPGISCKRRSQQSFQFRDALLNSQGPGRCILVPG